VGILPHNLDPFLPPSFFIRFPDGAPFFLPPFDIGLSLEIGTLSGTGWRSQISRALRSCMRNPFQVFSWLLIVHSGATRFCLLPHPHHSVPLRKFLELGVPFFSVVSNQAGLPFLCDDTSSFSEGWLNQSGFPYHEPCQGSPFALSTRFLNYIDFSVILVLVFPHRTFENWVPHWLSSSLLYLPPAPFLLIPPTDRPWVLAQIGSPHDPSFTFYQLSPGMFFFFFHPAHFFPPSPARLGIWTQTDLFYSPRFNLPHLVFPPSLGLTAVLLSRLVLFVIKLCVDFLSSRHWTLIPFSSFGGCTPQ